MPMLENPYRDVDGSYHVLRGNLHAHSTQSDGALCPQEVVDAYHARGHDFLMLSDHDVVSDERLYATLNGHGMILLPGNEISNRGPHLLHVGARHRVEPDANRQVILDEINRTEGFAIVNHPNWTAEQNHCTQAQMREMKGYAGIEIYNGIIGEGSCYAVNHWNMLLNHGVRAWGYANDDSHKPQHVSAGWNMVYVKNRSADAIIEALKLGRFYASTGVKVDAIEVDGMRVTVRSADAYRITAVVNAGRRLLVADGQEITVEAPLDKTVLRFELFGRGEQMAWTQPMYITA